MLRKTTPSGYPRIIRSINWIVGETWKLNVAEGDRMVLANREEKGNHCELERTRIWPTHLSTHGNNRNVPRGYVPKGEHRHPS